MGRVICKQLFANSRCGKLFECLCSNHSNSLQEEAGIRAPLQHAGSLLFMNEGADAAFQIEIYRADEYIGDITE